VCVLIYNIAVTKFESLELVALVIFSTASTFRLFIVHRPPANSDPVALSYTSLICESTDYLIPLNSTFVSLGDFNCSEII